MVTALPEKYEKIQMRLMNSVPRANLEDINMFFVFVLGEKKVPGSLNQDTAYNIAQILGLKKFSGRVFTHANAISIVDILLAFGERDWTDPTCQRKVFAELQFKDPQSDTARFIQSYYEIPNDDRELVYAIEPVSVVADARTKATVIPSILTANQLQTTANKKDFESAIVRKKLCAIGFTPNSADSIISFFGDNESHSVPASIDHLKSIFGIEKNLSKYKKQVIWQILLTSSVETIANPSKLSEYLNQCHNYPTSASWMISEHKPAIAEMIRGLDSKKASRASSGKPSVSKSTGGHVPASSTRMSFNDRKSHAAAAAENRPIKPMTPKPNYAEIFIDKFGFRHIADYTRHILQCADLILNQTISDDPIDRIFAAIMIMAKPDHNIVYLRNHIPHVFDNVPIGNEYITTHQKQIAESILQDGFAINISHAQRWCGTNKVEWRHFMAGALMAAHEAITKHITATNTDFINHPGFKWPEPAKHAPVMSDAFQRYAADTVAQALMGENGWVKVKTDQTPAHVMPLAAQKVLSRGSM